MKILIILLFVGMLVYAFWGYEFSPETQTQETVVEQQEKKVITPGTTADELTGNESILIENNDPDPTEIPNVEYVPPSVEEQQGIEGY